MQESFSVAPQHATAQAARPEGTGEAMLEQVLKRGVLRIGMSTFVPWAIQDKSGNFVGFEIDVANRLAQDMGVKTEFIPTKWSGIIPALLTGKFDIIIGGMGIRPERNLKVNFSIPYDYTGMSIVAHKKLASGFTKLSDFNNPAVSIAARTGTTAAAAAKQFMPKAKLRLFDDESQAIQELLLGRIHAVIASAPLPAFQAIANPDRLFLPLKAGFHPGADRLRHPQGGFRQPELPGQLDPDRGGGRMAERAQTLLVRDKGLGKADQVEVA